LALDFWTTSAPAPDADGTDRSNRTDKSNGAQRTYRTFGANSTNGANGTDWGCYRSNRAVEEGRGVHKLGPPR
jgi:hypothetical protein